MEKQDLVFNIHYLPIVVFVSLPTVFIVTYAVAVSSDHVSAAFPYISDVATHAPESCIFAQFVNMIAALMCLVIYIRYCLIKECTSAFRLQASLPKWNRWSLGLGLATTFGLTVAANFQEKAVLVVHMIGAFLCFTGGIVYLWTQAICSFYLHPLGCSLRMAHLRTALSTFCTVSFLVGFITSILSSLAFKGTDPMKWSKEDGGWELHVTSAVIEWICAFVFCVYILTFAEEFRDVRISHPKVICNFNRTRSSNDVLNESQDGTMYLDQNETATIT